MPASSDQRKRIKEKLPHELLKELYLNSRVSIKELEHKLSISHHTLSKCLKESEEKYEIVYTLDVNTGLLGFSEPRIIAVKFQERVPDVNLLDRVLKRDPFVQNAYLATGDFDLILHVIAENNAEFNYWLYKFRLGFSKYKPKAAVSTMDIVLDGFMPIKTSLINKSNKINASEKILLKILIENSRVRIKDISDKTKLSQMKVIYLINSMANRKIIRRFTSCIQNPDKRILLFYAATLIHDETHHPIGFSKFLNKIISSDNKNEITNDYAIESDASGYFDIIFFCNFKDWDSLNNLGPNFLREAWRSESPNTYQCMLTKVITGKWPFSKNSYLRWTEELDGERKGAIPFKIY